MSVIRQLSSYFDYFYRVFFCYRQFDRQHICLWAMRLHFHSLFPHNINYGVLMMILIDLVLISFGFYSLHVFPLQRFIQPTRKR